MTSRRRPWPILVVAVSVLLVVAIAADAGGPARGVLALLFYVTCPGLAVVGLLDVADPLAEALLAIAVSIAIGILVSVTMVLTHTWSPDLATALLATLSVLGALVQLGILRFGRASSHQPE